MIRQTVRKGQSHSFNSDFRQSIPICSDMIRKHESLQSTRKDFFSVGPFGSLFDCFHYYIILIVALQAPNRNFFITLPRLSKAVFGVRLRNSGIFVRNIRKKLSIFRRFDELFRIYSAKFRRVLPPGKIWRMLFTGHVAVLH